jgi:hypothetical protein
MWAGTFRSTMYVVLGVFPLVRGEITAELPTQAQAGTEGFVVFSYRGAVRNGEWSEFGLSYGGIGRAGKCVAFKGHSNVTRQTIWFTVELKTPDTIRGRYKTSSPEDRGSFVMRSQSAVRKRRCIPCFNRETMTIRRTTGRPPQP